MRGKLRPIFVVIGNFLDRWGNYFLPVLAAIIGVLFASADFFEFDSKWKNWIFWLGIILTFVFVICSVVIEQKRPRIKKLEEINNEQQEIIDEIADNIFFLFDGLILNLAKKLKISNAPESRVSLYVHDDDKGCFIPCGRYAANPELRKRGRNEYPDNIGCISMGWQNGWFFTNSVPKTRTAHQKHCQNNFQISKETHDQLNMLSTLYGVKQLSWNGSEPIAVIVVESLEKNSFEEADLKAILESVSDDYAETISVFHEQIIKSHTSKGVEE